MSQRSRRSRFRSSGPLVSLTVVIAVLAATALTAFGLGIADKAVAVYNASSWVWSTRSGELSRINGIKGSVDTRTKVKDSQGHEVQVTQSDRYLIIRDLTTGVITSIDLSTLQVAATLNSVPGFGISLALHNDVAFVIDSLQGVVRQVDPLTLVPLGHPIQFPPGLRGGEFDSEGRLWLLVPSEGTVLAVRAGRGAADPAVMHTYSVTDPQHDVSLSVLDKGVAILDHTLATLVTIRDGIVKKLKLPTAKSSALPNRTSGAHIPVTVADDRCVYVINQGTVREFEVPAEQGQGLRPAVAWAGWFYVADTLGDSVYVLDGEGSTVDRLRIKGGAGLELEVRDSHLFINPPGGDTATVIDEDHTSTPVPKFPKGIPGGE
ncbi:MAG: hypothetical protein H0T78_04435, partial [Longispora sp.]|nr:hypothetical protein [Longispora sp. (in: high G+C Gram-positive bacteria)]